jgi:hypothetical protein
MNRLLARLAERRRARRPDTLYTLRLVCSYLDAAGMYALSDTICAGVLGPAGAPVNLDPKLLAEIEVWLLNRGYPRLAAGMSQNVIERAGKHGRT